MTGPNRQMQLLGKARATASFDPKELMKVIHAANEHYAARTTNNDGPIYTHGLAKAIKTPAKAHLYNLDREEFIVMLKSHAGVEQQAYWLPLIKSGEVVGVYAESEVGHDVFVRGLETKATFDQANDEFLIHSPSISSTKYGIRGLSESTTHALVMARLFLKGVDYGVHAFIVQLRALNSGSNKILPGITLDTDGRRSNGYIAFNQLRIPRSNLLTGKAHLQHDGYYVPQPHYTDIPVKMGKLFLDNLIIYNLTLSLAGAANIATRYSALRTQGHGCFSDSPSEIPLLANRTQSVKLVALQGDAFALLFAGKACRGLVGRLTAGDSELERAYVEAVVEGLKAYVAESADTGVGCARRSCGLLGFSERTGFAGAVGVILPYLTDIEGLYQRTARYLVSCIGKLGRGEDVCPRMSFLVQGDERGKSSGVSFTLKDFVRLFRQRARYLLRETFGELMDTSERETKKLGRRAAWNTHALDLVAAAKAHVELFILESFVEEVGDVRDVAVMGVLGRLCEAWAAGAVGRDVGGFLSSGALGVNDLGGLKGWKERLEGGLAGELVALGEWWGVEEGDLGVGMFRGKGRGVGECGRDGVGGRGEMKSKL